MLFRSGDNIMDVTVVYAGPHEALGSDPIAAVGDAVREVRGDDYKSYFPVAMFVPARDYRRRKRRAAA